MSAAHPDRRDYATEQDWLLACADYLDELFPKRVEQRVDRMYEFAILRDLSDRRRTIRRIRAMLAFDEFTDEQSAEFDRLVEAFREHRRRRKALAFSEIKIKPDTSTKGTTHVDR